MQHESRVHKSILNARVNLFYYFLFLVLSLFSRKTFLDCLGADFIGLSGTLVEILGVLSLAEMGVGAAVAYHLYKPIESGNKKEIEALVSIFGYLYRKIGVFILVAAIIISCFIPLIFKNTIFSLGLIYFAFFSILLSSLLSYFINYRQILLSADQRGYVVTTYTRGAMFVKILIQMTVAAYLHLCQEPVLDTESLDTEWVNEPLADDICCLDNDNETPRLRLSDDQVWQRIIQLTGVSCSSDFQKLERPVRQESIVKLKELGASVRQLQRLTGIDRGKIQRAR